MYRLPLVIFLVLFLYGFNFGIGYLGLSNCEADDPPVDEELPRISVVAPEPWSVVSPDGFNIIVDADDDFAIAKLFIYVVVEDDDDPNNNLVVGGALASPFSIPNVGNVWKFLR